MQVFCKSFQGGDGVQRIVDNPIYMNQNFGITWSNFFFFFDLFSRNHFQSNRHRRTPTVGLASLIEADRAFPAMSDKYHHAVGNCLTKGWASLKILYNKKKTCSIRKNNCWFKWEKTYTNKDSNIFFVHVRDIFIVFLSCFSSPSYTSTVIVC